MQQEHLKFLIDLDGYSLLFRPLDASTELLQFRRVLYTEDAAASFAVSTHTLLQPGTADVRLLACLCLCSVCVVCAYAYAVYAHMSSCECVLSACMVEGRQQPCLMTH